MTAATGRNTGHELTSASVCRPMPNDFLSQLIAEFEGAARAAADGLPRNRFARVHEGRLKLKRRDALPIPRDPKRLRETFRASYPACGSKTSCRMSMNGAASPRAFQPLGGYSHATRIHTARCSPP